ncbi:hypothetical protein CEXT_301271 [Caerostris extrusa]|uniref:Uncharacterized protein n=1 Tax=Caerostris extrusa TaxID=172846 RepID=A0AAV4MDU1_CAEEX|nr:hypothetical protein CEXT_301271 [Caerostris extrusa]
MQTLKVKALSELNEFISNVKVKRNKHKMYENFLSMEERIFKLLWMVSNPFSKRLECGKKVENNLYFAQKRTRTKAEENAPENAFVILKTKGECK